MCIFRYLSNLATAFSEDGAMVLADQIADSVDVYSLYQNTEYVRIYVLKCHPATTCSPRRNWTNGSTQACVSL